jgi:hypothetical protein
MILALIIVSSCNKDPYNIGLDLLPGSDTLNVKMTDTATVIAYSLLQDSVRTDKATTLILGSIMDPVFGKTTASLYSQFSLSATGISFGTDPVLDSLILVLPYYTSYGNTSTLQNVRVTEISEDIHYDSIYYSNKRVGTYVNLLANYTFKPRPTDSVVVGKDTVAPQLRINLNHLTNYLGNKILTAPSSALASGDAFIAFMKGLCVETSPVYAGGALLSFNMSNSASKLVLYYHNSTQDTMSYVYNMPVTGLCAYFNHFDHNKYADASPEFKAQVINHDTAGGKTKLFLQGLGGVWTKVRLPYIKNFTSGGHHIALHNALLVIKNFETDTTLAPPELITIIKRDSLGNISNLIDYDEGAGYYGGTYNKTARTYSFRISRHIQQVLQGVTKNYDLYLMVNNPVVNVLNTQRVVVNGTRPTLPVVSSDRIQLQLIYTKVD